MSNAFQTAVRSNVQREKRFDAIDRMAERGQRRNLGIIVRMGGLDGEYRRRALETLGDFGGSEELADIAEDTTVEASLRRRAGELA